MAPDPTRPARAATFALVATAYAACEVASVPSGVPTAFGVGVGVVALVVAVAASSLLRPQRPNERPGWKASTLLALLLAAPLLVEPLVRAALGVGLPLELQLVNGLRMLGFGLAAAGGWPRCRHLAGVVSLFLALFAAAMGDQLAIPPLLVLLAVTGGVWLTLNHLAGQAGATAAGRTADAVAWVPLRFPLREAVVFGTLAAAVAAVGIAGPKRTLLALGELVPTSGGTGDADPFARYGTNDGPEEMAGTTAQSAGMVESDTMIEDNRDALIDLASDMYGPPHKPRKDQERMVAGGLAKVIRNHGKLPENRRPNREFDTSRKGPDAARKPEDRGGRGLYEVVGRTPLHVRVTAFDGYRFVDEERSESLRAVAGGVAAAERVAATLRWVPGRRPAILGLEPDGGDWMRVANKRAVAWYAADDTHQVKVADAIDNLTPTPPLASRVRIARVDKCDYYAWRYDGVLDIPGRRTLPAGVIVHAESRSLDRHRLSPDAFASTASAAPVLREVPEAIRAEVDRIADEWAGHLPRGWGQIDAVLTRLRTGYTLDRTPAPDGHPAPPLWFLSESHRGPDYLFATAAALLLRSLGYPTRVCLGFYARPDATTRTPDTPRSATPTCTCGRRCC
jgi:hypothetical protein